MSKSKYSHLYKISHIKRKFMFQGQIKYCGTGTYLYEVYSPTSGKLMAYGEAKNELSAKIKAGITTARLLKYYAM